MCGIWGIVNTRPRKFDYSTFCTLGIANDSRGGDSCGYFIDGHYEYGVGKDNKYFQCFFPDNNFLSELKESTIAFGHCRKASIGKIDKTTAQPVVLTNDNGEIDYVLMHNGTINNYEELAKKYIPEIDIKDMTDSQVMARIFYYKGYDVLSEYIGGAVFAIIDYRENKIPKVLLFKGASVKTKYETKETEERPLYFCIDKENKELVFSSIASYLMALRPEQITFDLTPNHLFKFVNGELLPIKKISRKSAYQNERIYNKSYNAWFYNDCFDIDDFSYDNFISLNQVNNTYSGKGKLLSGKYIISDFGKMLDKPCKTSTCKVIYFWNGVALRNQSCFQFLCSLKKEIGMPANKFNSHFNLLIRYLSIDRIFSDNNIWYEATSPISKAIFTGSLKMLTSTSSVEIANGVRRYVIYGRTSKQAFETLTDELNESFKDIKEKCKSLMK